MTRADELQMNIKYEFRDSSLLRNALTHTSYANENRKKEIVHNERLEFLGDAVLELVSSDYLYQSYPNQKEGDLTKLRAERVCETALAICAEKLHLGSYLLLGRGEEKNGGRERASVIANALEALIGAIYLDGGFTCARRFVLTFILKDIGEERLFYDSKTELQEIVQSQTKDPISYHLIAEAGPDHDKTFEVTVQIGENIVGHGSGHTKKGAEQNAAEDAISRLR